MSSLVGASNRQSCSCLPTSQALNASHHSEIPFPQVLFQPLSVAYHQEGTTLGVGVEKQALMDNNRQLFHRKWSSELQAKHCPRHVPAGEALLDTTALAISRSLVCFCRRCRLLRMLPLQGSSGHPQQDVTQQKHPLVECEHQTQQKHPPVDFMVQTALHASCQCPVLDLHPLGTHASISRCLVPLVRSIEWCLRSHWSECAFCPESLISS